MIGAPTGEPFWEPLTGRIAGDAGDELREAAASHVRRGDWPWLFWCAEEGCRKPLFPSEIRFAARRDERVGIAVVCSDCERASLNVVTPWHLDVPFFHDRAVEASDRRTRPRRRPLRRRPRGGTAARARAALAARPCGVALGHRRRAARHDDAVLAAPLGLVERLVGRREQRGRVAALAERRDAGRTRHLQTAGEAQVRSPSTTRAAAAVAERSSPRTSSTSLRRRNARPRRSRAPPCAARRPPLAAPRCR